MSRVHGGVRLASRKPASPPPIEPCPLPATLVVPLAQRHRAPAFACVAPGQRVRRGERIGVAQDAGSANVHAPASGVVHAIEMRDTVAGPGLCVVIDVDPGIARPLCLEPLDATNCEPHALLERIRDAGIVGLGGSAFPAASKLAGDAIELLILDGVECEPWVACDDALLRERADEVVQGARVMQRATGAQRVLLALDERMRGARDALMRADAALETTFVPGLYPAGSERQLIAWLTGREVPDGGLPRDLGVLVHNVATAAACWRAVALGEAMTTRLITVAGPGVASTRTFEAAFGTPVSRLVAQAGGYTDAAARLIAGGPMQGTALPHDDLPIAADTACVLVLGREDARTGPSLPCIRCGACAEACPARLLPQQLHFLLRAGDQRGALEHGLAACIECGSCDVVCPSNLPLAQQFRLARAELRDQRVRRSLADASRERYLARNARLARDAAERARAAAAKVPSASAAVQAALERARARKQKDE